MAGGELRKPAKVAPRGGGVPASSGGVDLRDDVLLLLAVPAVSTENGGDVRGDGGAPPESAAAVDG
uniref:DUF834 domain-containing protein n=1 Tax=Leersia perrieri TaxID=77586 RepID=A0A0D9VYW3_9ORYZ